MRALGLLAALVGILLTASSAFAATEVRRVDERISGILAEFRGRYGFPGAVVGYVLPDGRSGSVAIGFADAEAGIPMTTDNRMLAASIGKTFVGALVIALEREGVLHRSDPVAKYLKHLPWYARLPNAGTVTVGQLLNHTGGLPDHVHMDGVVATLLRKVDARPEDAIAQILDVPPEAPPGHTWVYSDTGYLVLGLVIEAASGQGFYELVDRRFIKPLSLSDIHPSNDRQLDKLAVGYTAEGNPFGLPARTMSVDGTLLWNPAVEWTGGGFVSTAGNLSRWGDALFTGKAMRGKYLDDLLDSVPVSPESPEIRYGSGVAIYTRTPLGPVYGHGGWIPGYISSLRHYAAHRLTIAFQINSDVGVFDHSSDLVPKLESALADALVGMTAGGKCVRKWNPFVAPPCRASQSSGQHLGGLGWR